MNHEEIFHLRDHFMMAALQGVLSNPNLVDKNTKANTIVSLTNAVVNRTLDQREQYYRYEDSSKETSASGYEYINISPEAK